MNKKLVFQIASPIMIALILVAMVLLQANKVFNLPLALNSLADSSPQRSEKINAPLAATTLNKPLTEYDAGEASVYRWRAMADAYEKNGLLIRDPFDYEKAADNLAFRWQAMAAYYKDHDMLTRPEPFDYEQAADNMTARWIAMAEYYKEHGMLTRPEPQLPLTGKVLDKPLTEYNPAEASAYRWEAMAKFYKEHGLLNEGSMNK